MWDPAAVSRTIRRLHLVSGPAAVTNARLTRRCRLRRSIAAQGCWPRSRAAPCNPGSPTGAAILRRRTLAATGWVARRPARPYRGRRVPGRHNGAPIDTDRSTGRHGRRPSGFDRHSAQLATRLGAARRPGRGGAAAGGSGRHPVGVAPAPVGRGLTRDRGDAGQWESRWRWGSSRCCQPLSPAGCSTSGGWPPTTRGAQPVRCSTRWRPTGRTWPPLFCPHYWKRCRAMSQGFGDVALFSIAQVVQPTEQTRPVGLIPTYRRPTDAEIARCSMRPYHTSPARRGRPVRTARALRTVGTGTSRGGLRCLRSGTGDRPGLRSRGHPAARTASALASGALRGGAGRRTSDRLRGDNCTRPPSNEPVCYKGTCAVELNLDAVPPAAGLPAPRVSPFPAVFQDLSLVVDVDIARPGCHRRRARRSRPPPRGRRPLRCLRRPADRGRPQIADPRTAVPRGGPPLTEDEASTARDAAVATAAERRCCPAG